MKTHAARERQPARAQAAASRLFASTHSRQTPVSAPVQAALAGAAASPALTAQCALQRFVDTSPRQTAQAAQLARLQGQPLQRAQDEDELQMKPASDALQREPLEEEEPMQGKFETAQRVEEDPRQGKFETALPVQRAEEKAKPNKTGLPDKLKSGIESLSGMSMDNVRVHYNSSQPAQLNALAYAQGTDIHVAPGQEQHLPHEAWHVVQQAQGRVKPTMQMKGGVPVNDDKSLEHEADVMGGKALQRQPARVPMITQTPVHRVVQRIRTNYKLKLPPSAQHLLTDLQYDDSVDQQKVDTFVDSLRRSHMDWYDDTTATMLESDQWNKAEIPDPFGGKAPVTLWQCPNCKQSTTYQGVHMGHITNWRLELKMAGVKNKNEAKMVYNNLLNLAVECATCNVSHAFERDELGHFQDKPTQQDFNDSREAYTWTIKVAKQKHKEFLQTYDGENMDEYDITDDFIDTNSQEYPAEFSELYVISVGDNGARAGLIAAPTLVTFTGETHPLFSTLQKVIIYQSESSDLKAGEVFWLSQNKSKQTY